MLQPNLKLSSSAQKGSVGNGVNNKDKKDKKKKARPERPQSLKQMKDKQVRRLHLAIASKIKTLQQLSTFENENDRNAHPKLQHIMLIHGEIVKKPHKALFERYGREGNLFGLLVPEGFDPQQFGKILMEVVKQMCEDSNKGYFITNNPIAFYNTIFGEKDVKDDTI